MTGRMRPLGAILALAILLAVPTVAAAGGPGESCAAPIAITSLPFDDLDLFGSQQSDDRNATGFSCGSASNGVDRVYEITVNPDQSASCLVQYVIPIPAQDPDGTSVPVTAVVSDGCDGTTEVFCERASFPSAITFPAAGTYYIWLDWDPSDVARIECTGALPVELTNFEIQ